MKREATNVKSEAKSESSSDFHDHDAEDSIKSEGSESSQSSSSDFSISRRAGSGSRPKAATILGSAATPRDKTYPSLGLMSHDVEDLQDDEEYEDRDTDL